MMVDQLPRWLPELCALFWPVVCMGCGEADRDCCARCLAALFHRVRGAATGDAHELQCALPPGVMSGYAAPYAGVAQRMLVGYKHAGRTSYAATLGRMLAAPLSRVAHDVAVASGAAAPPALVSLPSLPSRTRRRGYDHMTVLIRAALRGGASPMRSERGADPRHQCDLPYGMFHAKRALCTLPGRTSQVGLRAAEREANAMRIATRRSRLAQLRDRPVILVDDIITTGASMRGAYFVLAAAGVQVHGVVGLCAVSRADLATQRWSRN